MPPAQLLSAAPPKTCPFLVLTTVTVGPLPSHAAWNPLAVPPSPDCAIEWHRSSVGVADLKAGKSFFIQAVIAVTCGEPEVATRACRMQ